jgi:uncharacterized membrane protein
MLALHLLAAMLWIGGMAFAVLALRPSLAPLPPPQRLAVMTGVLGRFLSAVGVAIVLLVISGVALLAPYGGLRAAPFGVHAMIGLAVAMIAIYLYLYLALQRRLRERVQEAAWPQAGALAERARKLIVVNLVLGVLVVAAAVAAR